MKKNIPYIFAAFLTVFGVLTLFMSGSVIFDLFDVREKEGNYVLFVVWANFISSMIYLFSAYGITKKKNWVPLFLSISLTILTTAFIGLIIHIKLGGMYEIKTIGAMIFRIIVTLGLTIAAYLLNKKKN
jgi:hypothetical protein